MNNAFPFVEAGGKETNGSLMGLMRLGSTVGSRWGEVGQPRLLPAKPPAGKTAVEWKGRGSWGC